jgi:excisionase family DNA binding protein
VPASERGAAAILLGVLEPTAAPPQRRTVRLLGPKDETAVLTRNIAEAFLHMIKLLAQGRAVAILPADGALTTQAAAELLNVSRQYLVRLLDEGALPSFKVGAHRRVRTQDLLAYKEVRDAKRHRALDRLVELTETFGGYNDDAAPSAAP